MTREQQRVLGYCNRVRAELRLTPVDRILPGKKQRDSCPIANTIVSPAERSVLDLWASVSGAGQVEVVSGWPDAVTRFYADPPRYIKSFVDRFDAGKLPELVEGD